MSQRGRVQTPSTARLTGGLALAIAAISSAALVILLAHPVPPAVIAAARVAATGLVLTLMAGAAAPQPWRLARRDAALAGRLLLAGFLLAVHFGAWIASLSMTTVPRSVTLVATQPLFAGLVGRWLGDRVGSGLYVGAAVALAGTGLMVAGPGNPAPAGLGDGLALLAAAAAAGYLAVGRSLRDRVVLPAYLGGVHLLAAAMLAGWVVVRGVPWWPAGATAADFAALVYLGLVPGVVGHGLLNWAVRHAPVHIVSLAILLEPIGATALAVAVLGRGVAPIEIAGGAVILLGVGIGLLAGRRER